MAKQNPKYPQCCATCGGGLHHQPGDTPGQPTWCMKCDEPADDGERDECGGCGESYNATESDANDPDTYCSQSCEAEDQGSDDEDGVDCPVEDPDCLGGDGDRHDACEAPTHPPVTSVESQVYIDGGYRALLAHRRAERMREACDL